MNKAYTIIYNKARGQYIIVSELARKKRAGLGKALITAVTLAVMGTGFTLPALAAEPQVAESSSVTVGENATITIDKDTEITVDTDLIAIGSGITSDVDGTNNIIMGNGATLVSNSKNSSDSVTIGNNASGSNEGVTIGANAVGGSRGGVVIGTDAKAGGIAMNGVAIGNQAEANGSSNIALGFKNKNNATQSISIGADTEVGNNSLYSTVIGYNASMGANSQQTTAIGNTIDIGERVNFTTALGGYVKVGSYTDYATALGYSAEIGESAGQVVTIGYKSKIGANTSYATALGSFATIGSGSGWSTALGYNAKVADNTTVATAVGAYADIGTGANYSIALGYKAQVADNTANAIAIGRSASVAAANSIAIGNSSSVTADDVLTEEKLKDYQATQNKDYAAFDINKTDTNGVLSVGTAGSERRILNVARGRISADSTDAVNGSQLYEAAGYFDKKINEVNDNIKDIDVDLQAKDQNLEVDKKGDNAYEIGLADNVVLGGTDTAGSLTVQYGADKAITVNAGNSGMISGLANTTWDTGKYEGGGYSTSSNAATEAQLHGASNYLDNKITEVNNRVDGIDVDITADDENIEVKKNAKNEYELGLADNVVLGGEGVDGSLVVNGGGHSISISNGYVSGLANTTWDTGKYEKGEYSNSTNAATEAQLHGASNYLDNKITEVKNKVEGIDVDITADDENIEVKKNAKNEYELGLADNVVLGGEGADGSLIVNGGGHSISISNGYVSGLANTTWDTGKYEEGGYSASTNAATEAQLHGASNYLDNKITEVNNKIEGIDVGVDITADDENIEVKKNADNEYELGLADNVVLGGEGVDGSLIVNGGGHSISIGSGYVSGLQNNTWNEQTYKKGGYFESTNAATEGQLHDVAQKVDNIEQKVDNMDTNVDISSSDGNLVVKEDPAGGNSFDVGLGDNIEIGGKETDGSLVVKGDGTEISINKNNDGLVSGLTNTEWDENKDYSGSTNAATESQLQGVADHFDNRLDDIQNQVDNIDTNVDITNTDGNLVVKETEEGSNSFDVGLADNIKLGDKENPGSLVVKGGGTEISINKNNDGLVSGLTNTEWDENEDYSGSTNAATESQLHDAMQGTVQYDRDEAGNVDKGNITLDKDGTGIHNVADGEISADSKDAVNGSQLHQVQEQVDANTTTINNLNGKINDLDGRIDKVGAGAAALAALHPLDFDPDDKWNFAAGSGNYGGETAVALGAFYRPDEKTMVSLGGTVGNGENMVNLGVAFKLGRSSGVHTSRVAMAKEIKDLRQEIASMRAAMLAMNNGKKLTPSQLQLFPKVEQNNWAYLAAEEVIGAENFTAYISQTTNGARPLTRYEFAEALYQAMLKGAVLPENLLTEFAPELGRFTVDAVYTDEQGKPTVERVRVMKGKKDVL